jgi:hypothetical protein
MKKYYYVNILYNLIMNSGTAGSFNRTRYDNCATQKYYYESTSPLKYRLYHGAQENCNKCKSDKQFWTPYELVDIESELRNQTRPLSQCDSFKYTPQGSKLPPSMLISTFDKSVPTVFAPEICPIVSNNIRKWDHPGYVLSDPRNFCRGKNPLSTVKIN